jgi:hypothetical protein
VIFNPTLIFSRPHACKRMWPYISKDKLIKRQHFHTITPQGYLRAHHQAVHPLINLHLKVSNAEFFIVIYLFY